MKNIYLSIFILITISLKAQDAITIPAEFEKNDNLVLTWSYTEAVDTVLAEIAQIAEQAADISIIYNPDSTQFDTIQINSFLHNMGVDTDNVCFIPAVTNTCWLGQYSPVVGYGVFTDTLALYLGNPGFSNFGRPDDDRIPAKLADYWSLNLSDYSLQFENTNIQYDGMLNLFVGDNVLQQNLPMDENEIRFDLNSYFGSGNVFFTPNFTHMGGGDILSNNMYMKILDFETILVSEIPDTLPDYNALEDFASDISVIPNKFGGNYNIIRISDPPNADGKYPITQNEEVRSYTNSLIVNNIVIIPSFGLPYYDSAAYHTYRKYMPGYHIFMIDSHLLSANYGGVNTVAKEIPQANFLRILHEKNIGTRNYAINYEIICLSSSSDLVQEMWLYYKLNSDTSYTKTEIHLVCPQHFGVIENLLPTDTVHYYIEAISTTTTTTYPLSASVGNFTFWFDVVGINNISDNSHKYSIAPNPTKGSFMLLHKNYSGKVGLSIFNINGQKVIEIANYHGGIINADNMLDAGCYAVLVNDNGIISRQKLVIY